METSAPPKAQKKVEDDKQHKRTLSLEVINRYLFENIALSCLLP